MTDRHEQSSAGSESEYQRRTPERLVELLRSFGYGPRSWQAEAADTLERMHTAAQPTRETALEAAALDFIAKVDRGEARSTKSYAAFKAALASQPSPAATVTDGSIQEGDVLSYTMDDGVGKVTAHVRPHNGSSAGRETVAKIIYDAFPFEARIGQAQKPEWIPHGNSIRQDDARRAADLIRALPQTSGVWQPIETAPKDGTPVIIAERTDLSNGSIHWYIETAVNYYETDMRSKDVWFEREGSKVVCDEPTHWQPLPTPPLPRPQSRPESA